ncbi:uncharacterized protein LOC112872789 [Panicum hallii]|uniref:uncharacterized protein LOC112872789 n=1 Tax=Panicum hallii TaxID=206008 RepID=UPI000DF4D7AD|nr:uncharacterized protein LOC112872789 [Panicum hallii]
MATPPPRRHRAARATMATPPPPEILHCRSLLDLAADLIPEILLRLPPHDPGQLVRCTTVCKPWRRLLTDPAFLRRYREFHGPPPMLGFLFYLELPRDRFVARFVRTTPFRPRALDHRGCYVRDARHGRVLFSNVTNEETKHDLLVWNPITGERWGLPLPVISGMEWNVTVLCAAAAREGGGECDHLDCHRGPSLVAFVGSDEDGTTCAYVYSSEAATWSDAAYAEHNNDLAIMDMEPCTLVGNRTYCLAAESKTIVEYDLGRRKLAFIDRPLSYQGRAVLMPAMGGGLGFAGVRGSCLYLWSRETGPDRTATWTQSRVLELSTLPGRAPLNEPATVGFAEGLGVIFVRTDAGVFAINLKSGRVKKMSNREGIYHVIPYTSFHTPGNF